MVYKTRDMRRVVGRQSLVAAQSRSPWLEVREAVSRKVLGRAEAGKDVVVWSGGCRSCWQRSKRCDGLLAYADAVAAEEG